MVQMGDTAAVERVMFNLNGVFVFNSKMIITYVDNNTIHHSY